MVSYITGEKDDWCKQVLEKRWQKESYIESWKKGSVQLGAACQRNSTRQHHQWPKVNSSSTSAPVALSSFVSVIVPHYLCLSLTRLLCLSVPVGLAKYVYVLKHRNSKMPSIITSTTSLGHRSHSTIGTVDTIHLQVFKEQSRLLKITFICNLTANAITFL